MKSETRPPKHRKAQLTAAVTIVLLILGGLWWLYQPHHTTVTAGDSSPDREQITLGQRIFEGQEPLPARLAGHDEVLPAMATRCVNCHSPAASAAPGKSGFAPTLSADWLARPHPRRGGPPSAYDVRAFCRLLRDGIDPAQVLIDTTMPRYPLSNEQCAALWTFVNNAR